MSEPHITTPVEPAASADAPAMPIDPDAWHYVHGDALDLAEELDVEVPARIRYGILDRNSVPAHGAALRAP